MPAEFLYLAAPATEDKALLVDLQESNLIHALNGFSEEAMAAYLDAIAPKTSTP